MEQSAWIKEIQRLQDIEAIKQLKYRYAEICDDNHNPDRICSLFTPEAIWDGGEDFGRFVGHGEIRKAFAHFAAAISFSRHHFTNSIIEVNEDTAKGTWYMIGVFRKNGKDSIQTVTYHDEYVKIDGKWLMSRVSPYSTYEKNLL
jgi:hypothetical protein